MTSAKRWSVFENLFRKFIPASFQDFVKKTVDKGKRACYYNLAVAQKRQDRTMITEQ